MTIQKNRSTLIVAIGVALISFIVYFPALQNGFVKWDDDLYVYENQGIRSLDFSFFIWSFTANVGLLWHPITLFSLALDYAVWGINPLGYHLTNILFHALNTSLVFIIVNKIIEGYGLCRSNKGALVTGFVTSLLFGIHPLHAESVAWISERKDVLSAFFFLLSLLAYLKYATSRDFKRTISYIVCLTLFILALMSKPMVVTFPLVLLLLDFYPLKRLLATEERIKSVFMEKIPFLGLSILSSAITIWIHHSTGGLKTFETVPFIMRILTAIRSHVFYLIKMVFPFNLGPLYPYPFKIDFLSPEYLGYFISFTAILYSIWLLRESKLFLALISYYTITLLPVIGLIQVGEQAAADRYTYLPSLGPFFLIGLGIRCLFERYSGKRYGIPVLILLLFLLSGMLINRTLTQITIWHDSFTLWNHQITLFPEQVELAYNTRALAYEESGNLEAAIEDYNMAIKLNPKYPKAYYNRGNVYNTLGDYPQAIKDYNVSIALYPLYPAAYYMCGDAFLKLGNYDQAIGFYTAAIRLNPMFAKAYYDRGVAYSYMGNYKLAGKDFKKAANLGL